MLDTRKAAAEFRLSHWAQILNEREESGLSIKAFCASAGFHENKYYYWQRRLREAACEEMSTVRLIPSTFVEVKPQEELNLPAPVVAHQSQISIETGRVSITADSEYPIGKLVQLLREVTRSC